MVVVTVIIPTYRELGAKVELLNKARINEKFPWINTEDVEMGCYGLENEGW